MQDIDNAIYADKRRHRRFVFIAIFFFLLVAVSYFSWLFAVRAYYIQVIPLEADMEASVAVEKGVGVVSKRRLYVLSESAQIVVSANTFLPETLLVTDRTASNIVVELLPKPADLRVHTDPSYPDSRWWVNGEWQETGASFMASLPPGEYSVRVTHPFLNTYEEQITLTRAQTLDLRWTLEPVNGTLQIRSTPAGAEVMIDGQPVGMTPFSATYIGGEYNVEVHHPDYQPVVDKLMITQEQPEATRQYQLRPQQAQVTITTTPEGGVLLLNGQPVTSPLEVEAKKQHELRYEKPGYIEQRRKVMYAPGEKATIAFDLRPSVGEVVVTSTPTASVKLGDKLLGQTPLTLSLPTVPAVLQLAADGYRTVNHRLVPVRDKSTQVHLNLLTEFAARRKEGTPLAITGLGIRMKPVTPALFTMGSPPNEPFRAPNEHQYEVQLSTPFWLSLHEVTEAQYAAFDPSRKAGGAEPVTEVSWLQAAAYANWLSEKEGLPPFYLFSNGRLRGVNPASAGYRLPTEAEWEYVAKHFARSAPTQYVWGSQDTLRKKQGNFADKSLKGKQTFVFDNYEDGFAGKAPVGSFKADRNGFFDLDGNVREWVHDFYVLAPSANQRPLVDYQGPASGNDHVIKGAGYLSGRMKELRASIREKGSDGAPDVGFRLARYFEESER